MKKRLSWICILSILLLCGQVAFAGNEEKIEQGKKLFNDPTFAGSTNDKSCNTCHPDGKKIGKATGGDYTKIVNRCIVGALKGHELEGDNEEMQALQAYLHSLTD